jgi:hypothetical protein
LQVRAAEDHRPGTSVQRAPAADLGRYELPFTPVDREVELTIAHEEFTRRAAAR